MNPAGTSMEEVTVMMTVMMAAVVSMVTAMMTTVVSMVTAVVPMVTTMVTAMVTATVMTTLRLCRRIGRGQHQTGYAYSGETIDCKQSAWCPQARQEFPCPTRSIPGHFNLRFGACNSRASS